MSIQLVKSIRARTNLSYKEIQKAIEQLQTEDEEKIIDYLRQQGVLKAQARQSKQTNQGMIFAYVHEGRIGVLVEIKCETDFVARSEEFQNLGRDIALHLAANQPKFLDAENIDPNFLDKELNIAREQLLKENKPEQIIEKILEGKKAKIIEENTLMSQPFLKEPEITVADLVNRVSQMTGEKIVITRFVIYNLNA